MALVITSRTDSAAADNTTPNSRRTIGAGERILFSTTAPAHWTVAGTLIAGRRTRELDLVFKSVGVHHVTARSGRDSGTTTIRVVAPSTRVEIVSTPPVASGYVGVCMELRTTLTPRNVSFVGLQYRELDCDAEDLSGYFDTLYRSNPARATRMLHHTARPSQQQLQQWFPGVSPSALSGLVREWTDVNPGNVVANNDIAAFQMRYSDMDWPVTNGQFHWEIPREYRLAPWHFGQSEVLGNPDPVAFARPITQAVRIAPQGGSIASGSYRGDITIWKGGESATQTY